MNSYWDSFDCEIQCEEDYYYYDAFDLENEEDFDEQNVSIV